MLGGNKKKHKHKVSFAHNGALETVQERQKYALPNQAVDIQSSSIKKADIPFRTAYTIVKERPSFKQLMSLMKMQELNGNDVGNIH